MGVALMKQSKKAVVFFLLVLFMMTASAGERTIPVDIYVLIDKSLSMDEPGKFESMHTWVRDYLAKQVLINGDSISIYQFYGRVDPLLKLVINSEEDRQSVISTINSIQPDNPYTNIGLSFYTLKEELDSLEPNNRYKILFMLTDLKHEAPWSSRYAGVQDTYESPYLAEARIVQHDSWYEITLDMDIQDHVVKTSEELFSSILETGESPRQGIESDGFSAADEQNPSGDNASPDGEKGTTRTSASSNKDSEDRPLHPSLPIVILSLLVIGVIAGGVYISRRRLPEEDDRQNEHTTL